MSSPLLFWNLVSVCIKISANLFADKFCLNFYSTHRPHPNISESLKIEEDMSRTLSDTKRALSNSCYIPYFMEFLLFVQDL